MLIRLYLIEILHQTTTVIAFFLKSFELYLIEILHQTTTSNHTGHSVDSCILSKFYIKPQHFIREYFEDERCILSKFYIKPQRRYNLLPDCLRCILSKFYIKPQHQHSESPPHRVVSYRNSTSNHNGSLDQTFAYLLYLIEILHQTTTEG